MGSIEESFKKPRLGSTADRELRTEDSIRTQKRKEKSEEQAKQRETRNQRVGCASPRIAREEKGSGKKAVIGGKEKKSKNRNT